MEITWDYAVVAFIDVLGFSSFVAQDAKSLTPHHLERLRESLSEAKKVTPSINLEVRAFSDSIIISTNLSSQCVSELFEAVVNLQRIFIKRHVLIRGAIAFGKHFADAELIYSDALIKAYYEERDQARFPRVLINKDLLDWFMNDGSTTKEIKEKVNLICMTDRDNRVFLHYLDRELLKPQLDFLNTYKSDNLTASVLEKVQWLGEYHNFVANQLNVDEKFNGTAIQGFRPLGLEVNRITAAQ